MTEKRQRTPEKVERVRATVSEVRDDDIAAPPAPASEPPPAAAIPPPSNAPIARAADRSLTVRAEFEATERRRLDAIERSAEALLDRMLAGGDDRAVWNLREAVWPALCLSDFRDVQLRQVQLTLFPLSRIGQMEGKSGSLVLVGRFSAQPLGDLQSHPVVIKTRDRSKPDPTRLDDEFKNGCAVKPFAYDRKDGFAIPVFFDDEQDGYKVLWSICSLSGPVWGNHPAVPDEAQPFKVDDLRTPIREGKDDRVRETLKEVFDLLRNCHLRFNLARTEEKVVGEEYGWYLRAFGVTKAPETVWGPEWAEVWGGITRSLSAEARVGRSTPFGWWRAFAR